MTFTVSPTLLAAGLGLLAAAAVLILIAAFQRRPLPNLQATITGLRESATHMPSGGGLSTGQLMVGNYAGERPISEAGRRFMRLFRLSPSPALSTHLELRGISSSLFYGQRLMWAAAGFVFPALAGVIVFHGLIVPLGLSLVGGIAGWFWPLIASNRAGQADSSAMNESILVFIDLVVLERLSNATAGDALRSAASMSDQPLFRQILTACDRADLQQENPWVELGRLAQRLRLTALQDIVDIARMQDDGAALSGALRARVKDLRNEWVADQLTAANRVSTRMTLPMGMATVILSLIFIAPVALQLFG